jgi:hypothetical protein
MKRDNLIGSTMAAVVIFLCMAAAYAMNPIPRTMEQKWEKFERRTRNSGDAGCEKQYQKIFGHPSEGHCYSGHY